MYVLIILRKRNVLFISCVNIPFGCRENTRKKKKKLSLLGYIPTPKWINFLLWVELSGDFVLESSEILFSYIFSATKQKEFYFYFYNFLHFDEKWCWNLRRSQDEIAREAIKHALKALRKRHLLEEGAHGPAFIALSRPILSQVFSRYVPFKSYDFQGFDFLLLVNLQVTWKHTSKCLLNWKLNWK